MWGAIACLAGPSLLQILIAILDLTVREQDVSLSAVMKNSDGWTWLQPFGFLILVLISVLFSILADLASRQRDPDLVQIKTIIGDFKIGNSNVHCYLGDVSHITEVDVIVTSEDTSLDLGSISGTSVSGRVRKLAATKNLNGEIETDNLRLFLSDWKEKAGKQAGYDLGHTVLVSEPFCAAQNNIQAIILAVALRKDAHNRGRIEESAVFNIVKYSVAKTIDLGHRSIFIPIFGLGSGGVSIDDALSATVKSVASCLRQENVGLEVYLGVYRDDHLAELLVKLQAASLTK